MRWRFRFVPLLVTLIGQRALSGQEPATSEEQARAVCTYDRCALRIEASDVVRGTAGERVGRMSVFRRLRLDTLRPSSDSATRYALEFDRNYRTGWWMLLGGALLASPGPAIVASGAYRDWSSSAVAVIAAAWVVGSTFEIVGVRKVRRAQNALGKAVWWYNRQLLPP